VAPLHPIMLDMAVVRIILVSIGVIGILAIYFAFRKKDIGIKQAKGPLLQLDLEKNTPVPAPGISSAAPAGTISTPPRETAPQVPAFKTYPQQSRTLSDLFRAFLIVLTLVVAAGFVLILLSQSTIDKIAKDFRSQNGAAQPEKIALLFLGDELKDNEFQIRAVVRNITNAPIEQLDAAVRLYSNAGRIMETVVVRMDKEIITPDETSQFRLVYPNYKTEFSRYAVEFKLRQGAPIAYKDLRANQQQIHRNP
jgi:hypothetical protein